MTWQIKPETNRLAMDGYDDVWVGWTESLSGKPFLAHIGGTQGEFDYLQDAVDWATQTAQGRDVMWGKAPIVDDDDAAVDTQFYEERGLTG